MYIIKEGTGVNRFKESTLTYRLYRYWSEPRKHDRKRHTSRAATANKLVPILATRRVSKDGCRFRCTLCAVGRVKADRRGPKGHTCEPAWQDGAWKARYARENLRRAPCRASSAPQWWRYLAEYVETAASTDTAPT